MQSQPDVFQIDPTDLEREARRRWDAKERTFPLFTRMRWEDGTPEARATTLAYTEAVLIAQRTPEKTKWA